MPQARFDPALPPVALPQAAWEARVLQPALPTVALVSGFEIDQKRQKQTQSIRPVDRPFINYTRNPSKHHHSRPSDAAPGAGAACLAAAIAAVMAASCGDLEIAKQTQNEWIFCGRKGKGRRKGNGRENEGHLRHVQSKRNLEFCCNFTLCLVASFPGIKTEQLQELVAELQLVQQSLPLLVEKTFC